MRDSEAGFTLIELLVAASLMIVVLGATLSPFESFTNNTHRNFDFNDQQDRVRNTLDQIVRQARNLANPTTGATGATPTTIAFADSNRFVFQTTDPQKQWVSYCLDDSTATREKIWYQTTSQNSLTPAAVSASTMIGPACPSTNSNWQSKVLVSDYVTNNKTSSNQRPFFTYYDRNGAITSLPVASSSTPTIVKTSVSIYLQLQPGKSPGEAELASTAWMRNQNQAPTASFLASLSGTTYTFDGGDSSDPESRTLLYDWYTAPANTTMTVPSASTLPSCSAATPIFPATATGWACLGTAVVVSKTGIGSKYVFLRVTDPGNLQSMTSFPATGGCPTAISSSRAPTACGAVS